MHKKDYVLIAGVIKGEVDSWRELGDDAKNELGAVSVLAHSLADKLQEDNALFNRDTFMKACGL